MWELVSFVNSDIRRKCLVQLKHKFKRASWIARKIKKRNTHVNRALRELESKGLVVSGIFGNDGEVFFKITPLGRRVLRKVKEIDNS